MFDGLAVRVDVLAQNSRLGLVFAPQYTTASILVLILLSHATLPQSADPVLFLYKKLRRRLRVASRTRHLNSLTRI
jgi:hypothetical protein